MKQAIAGVTPSTMHETTVMVVWPSISAYTLGRWLGRAYQIKLGTYVFTIGNALALLSIPIALFLYFFRLAMGKSYKLTNRRVIELGTSLQMKLPVPKVTLNREVKSVDLDRFDSITIERLPGHEWFDAGNLIFKLANVETFRLDGVSRPESFRHTCLKSQMAYVGVRKALQHEPVPA